LAKIIKTGVTRIVVLVSKYAIKMPRADYGWTKFLQGLLANMQEAQFSGMPGVCPVLLAIPGGFLNVMLRAEPLTGEIPAWVFKKFCEREDYRIPAEYKTDSFGVLNGCLVAVDYGN
jgi:hypothetical protein